MIRDFTFKIGDISSKKQILEIFKGSRLSNTFFKVLCLRCKHEYKITHQRFITPTLNPERAGCRLCSIYKDPQDVVVRKLYDAYAPAAKRRNIEFKLTKKQIKEFLFKNCYYCGREPRNKAKLGRIKVKEILYHGIDRVNNDMGYVVENCVTACRMCNIAKNNYSLQEFQNWIKDLTNYQLNVNIRNIGDKK